MPDRSAPDPKYGLGLPITSNELVSHHELWTEAYATEAVLISDALGGYVAAIEHIGSTAVQGLIAKPIIDIQIGVTDMVLHDAFIKGDGDAWIRPLAQPRHSRCITCSDAATLGRS